MNVEFKTVDEYIASFPKEVQEILLQVRNTILQHAPQATEGIAYGMPAYKLKGKPLVYFGGYQKHIGFYATPTGHSNSKQNLLLISKVKVRCSFRYGSRSHLNSSQELLNLGFQRH
ncbi:iron chaperone [Sphingobacterium sp. IITKGP-BTPF85]|uniref:iron chaperone n=1 Tax=Sphingobacterium sp. IITKGP-BTPF85 TaxID=1338009 RepID=UPI00041E23BD|nr:DUF1801 domain-containing protein [Sphingobacterium sp. IITKGP-BTPF85]KKX49211.1 hypothetical protein L950_0216730 [Sphingobacterium sp. IITKGP-BTPF85]